MTIYEIENKPYVKVENFYAEVKIVGNIVVPTEKLHKIYCTDVKGPIKTYSVEEYKKKGTKQI